MTGDYNFPAIAPGFGASGIAIMSFHVRLGLALFVAVALVVFSVATVIVTDPRTASGVNETASGVPTALPRVQRPG